jgi:tetratricopeptide (TPR) repeat protein
VQQLSRQNPEVAAEFAGDVIDKIQTANVATDTVAWWIGLGLLRAARPRQDVAAENGVVAGSGHLNLSDDQKRTLVEILTEAALGATTKPDLVSGLASVMPEIEQFAPDRAAKIKMKLADVNRTQTSELRGGKYDALVSKGTPEELLKAAAGADNSERDALFQAAVWKAVMTGKGDALRESIRSEVEDQSQRNRLNDLLDAQLIGWDASHGDTESLQKMLPSIRLKEKRAVAMAQIAMLLEKKGEHDEALKLLDEAQTLVKVDLNNQAQSDALLAVLLAYSIVDPPKAFATIEPIVDRANDNMSKLLLLDKVIKSGFVKNGEIIMQQPGMISPDFAILRYGKGIVALAKADFNRTKALADRLQRNELRIMARLLIVQALLHNNEKAVKNNAQ